MGSRSGLSRPPRSHSRLRRQWPARPAMYVVAIPCGAHRDRCEYTSPPMNTTRARHVILPQDPEYRISDQNHHSPPLHPGTPFRGNRPATSRKRRRPIRDWPDGLRPSRNGPQPSADASELERPPSGGLSLFAATRGKIGRLPECRHGNSFFTCLMLFSGAPETTNQQRLN